MNTLTFICILLLCGYCSANPVHAPTFSNAYTAKGSLYIPYAEIREPFYAWYDGKGGRSRIDYYGGMVKTYQLSTEGPYGSSIKVAPITTEEAENQQTCLQVNGTYEQKITPQTIIPDTTGMQCIGSDMINGVECEKWRLVETIGEKTNKYTLWIRYKKSSSSPPMKEVIPVRYEMKGFNTLLGSHYDHYYLEYDWFSSETPSSEVFEVEQNSVCGSCWSFGTTGAVEGAYYMKYKKLVRLSQQALIDCSWGFGNNGCDGGEDFRSYQWIIKHGGLPTEEEYGGYLGQDGYCHVKNVTQIAKLKGFVNVKTGDIDAMKLAIFKHGPISVAIDASHKTFSFYSNGVYYEPSCGNTEMSLDHAVLAVGYGTMNGKGYWLVKNSWSNYWGNDGYILMAQKDNNCGVLTAPTYAIAA